MKIFNKLNLDVKKTVETTLNRANSWLFGNFPSASRPESKIKIDVRYFGEKIPFEPNETVNEKQLKAKGIDFSQSPVFVRIQREGTNIVLKRSPFIDNIDKKEKETYSIFIQDNQEGIYRIVQTADGKIFDMGITQLVPYLSQDKDFNDLVSFVKKGEKDLNSLEKWNLNRKMLESR